MWIMERDSKIGRVFVSTENKEGQNVVVETIDDAYAVSNFWRNTVAKKTEKENGQERSR